MRRLFAAAALAVLPFAMPECQPPPASRAADCSERAYPSNTRQTQARCGYLAAGVGVRARQDCRHPDGRTEIQRSTVLFDDGIWTFPPTPVCPGGSTLIFRNYELWSR